MNFLDQLDLDICPECGENWQGWGQSATSGLIEYASCCAAPLEIIANWEIFAGLPPQLQRLTRDRIAAKWAEIRRIDAESERDWHRINDMMRAKDLLKFDDVKFAPMHERACTAEGRGK